MRTRTLQSQFAHSRLRTWQAASLGIVLPTLQHGPKTLSDHSEVSRVEVQGHTDDQGVAAHNLDLSLRRWAVRKWSLDAGIVPHRLVGRGYGNSRPMASDTNEQRRALNRRAHFVVGGEHHGSLP